VKTDASGNIQWQNTIGGSGDDAPWSIRQTTDGGYILGGLSDSPISGDKTENGNGGLDYWIVKTDANGNIQWQNTIGGSYDDEIYSIQQTTDGGYILGGFSSSPISGDKTENSNGSDDYWIVKTDESGNIQWQNTIGGNITDQLTSIQQTNDGGYILGGYSASPISGDKTENSNGGPDYWTVKTDASGNIQWQSTIGGSDDDRLRSIQQTTDGGYILGGYSDSNISGDKTENSNGGFDYWIVKLAPDNTGVMEQVPINGALLSLAPNPVSTQLSVTSTGASITSIAILNALGENIRVEQQIVSERSRTVDVSTLARGMYTVRLVTSEGIASVRFVKE
jgi:hypothetical protein